MRKGEEIDWEVRKGRRGEDRLEREERREGGRERREGGKEYWKGKKIDGKRNRI